MKEFNNKIVVVTGAASGMGQALAVQLSDLGCNLALCDINEKGLQNTLGMIKNKKVKVTTHYLDVSNREEFFKYADEVAKIHGGIDMVINNAGGVILSPLETITYEGFKWQMDTNFWSVVNGTQAFLPYLRKRKEGHLVNLSSIYGIMPGINVGAYNASKYAVKGFNECLAAELRNTSIKVTSIHPGGIKTAFARDAKFERCLDPFITKPAMIYIHDNWRFITTAEKAAAIIIKGIRKEKKKVLVGPDAKVFDWIARTFPGAIGPLVLLAENFYTNRYKKWVKKGKI